MPPGEAKTVVDVHAHREIGQQGTRLDGELTERVWLACGCRAVNHCIAQDSNTAAIPSCELHIVQSKTDSRGKTQWLRAQLMLQQRRGVEPAPDKS